MKQDPSFSRYRLLWKMILCYFCPWLGLLLYGAFFHRASEDWILFSLGLLLTAWGSLALFWMMTRWEKQHFQKFQRLTLLSAENPHLSNENQIESLEAAPLATPLVDPQEHDLTKRSLAEAQQMQIRLLSEIDALTEELQQERTKKDEALQEINKIQAELEQAQRDSMMELEQQQQYIRELQEGMASQKDTSEKKQHQLLLLETKVGNLTSEIKTLLQSAETQNTLPLPNKPPTPAMDPIVHSPPRKELLYTGEPPPSDHPTRTKEEASKQLQICLEIAQKIKASQRFGSQIYSFLDSPADNFSLDLRRLCDRLRGESQTMILLYSPRDHQLLFASNPVKALTGWSPEKFVQNFREILLDEPEWRQGVYHLAIRSEEHIHIHLKMKSGSQCRVNVCLGMIPTGIFRDHALAILYTPDLNTVHLG